MTGHGDPHVEGDARIRARLRPGRRAALHGRHVDPSGRHTRRGCGQCVPGSRRDPSCRVSSIRDATTPRGRHRPAAPRQPEASGRGRRPRARSHSRGVNLLEGLEGIATYEAGGRGQRGPDGDLRGVTDQADPGRRR